MECMGNQENSENDLPLLPKSYEEFCEMFPLEQVELNIPCEIIPLEQAESKIPPVGEELFEDNQYPSLDDSDFLIPQSITEFFHLYPLYAALLLPDDMFRELFSERILLKELSDNFTLEAANDSSTNNVTPNDKCFTRSKTERSRKEGETLLWTLGGKKNEDKMDRLVTFVYHHMGALKRGVDSNVIYDEGLVTEIHRVNVETCNLFFVEGLFLDLGYPGYNEVYWLEPGLDLGKGLRVLRTDAEVMRMCESAMKNDNTVHLYFDHPIDANPEIIDEEVVSDGSSDSVVEVNPGGDNVNEVEQTNKVDGESNEKENEGVNETSGEINELNMALSVVVKENVNEVVNEATVDVNESNKGDSGAGEEAANNGNGEKDTDGASAPEKSVKKVKKRHPRPPPSGLPRERRAAENEVPESNPRKAEAVNEPTEETYADDVNDLNEGFDFGEPSVDEQSPEEPVTENSTENVTQTSERTNARRNHPRPQPSGQRIVPGKEDEAPRVEVPNPNREDSESEPNIYQYESEELCSPPVSDDEEEPVFSQHNPNTPYGKITLELNMEFETMDQFKAAVQKYNIQIGRQVFYLRNEKKRCRVICYDPDCPWLCYCARTNYPASFQIKTFVDEHTCPRSNKSKSVSCAWVAEELVPKLRIHPNMLQREAQEWFKVEYDISVNERMVYRAMEKAKEVIEGTEKDQRGEAEDMYLIK
ncbi:hypothetical protein Ahy_B09g098913 [Arachis hypogaea]|uniref:Uncharacterized protein n=1 Tax=Arachis hypogaea TaxID=3818 RepID=A0A444XSG3_ARAHY|nr:hypothetical protein Ahy_B09g098913 [Arachis hypogaea]